MRAENKDDIINKSSKIRNIGEVYEYEIFGNKLYLSNL